MKLIAVLITVHNRKTQTLACLNALFRCLLPNECKLDVFLVDDGCSDGTPETIKEQFPQVKVIHGTENLFWNRGTHLAWTTAANHCSYDYYLWLNDDTTLFPDTIGELLACAASEDNQKIVSGSTCSMIDKNKITYGGKTVDGKLLIPNGQKQNCAYCNGNIVLISKHVFSVVGTNDPIFRHALGDFDYGKRARKLGIGSVILPNVSGVCEEHEEFAAWCNSKTPLIKRFRLLYTPLGNHPIEFFKYDCRHHGVFIAIFHFITIHLRVIVPNFWKNRDK